MQPPFRILPGCGHAICSSKQGHSAAFNLRVSDTKKGVELGVGFNFSRAVQGGTWHRIAHFRKKFNQFTLGVTVFGVISKP
jgi:hypothetical protein